MISSKRLDDLQVWKWWENPQSYCHKLNVNVVVIDQKRKLPGPDCPGQVTCLLSTVYIGPKVAKPYPHSGLATTTTARKLRQWQDHSMNHHKHTSPPSMRDFSHGKCFFLWETVGLYNVPHWCRCQLLESPTLILLILVMHLVTLAHWCRCQLLESLTLILLILVMHLVMLAHWCRCQVLEIHMILTPHIVFSVDNVTCRWNLDHNFVLLLRRGVWRSGSDSNSRRSSRHVRGWVGVHHGPAQHCNTTDQSANQSTTLLVPQSCRTQCSTSCWARQWF